MTGQGPPASERDPDPASERDPDPASERDPHADSPPDEEPLNTGIPASTPPGPSLWGDDVPWTAPGPTDTDPAAAGEERFAPPDPAAVAGPPWPRLVARPGYQPPPMLRWPIAVVMVAAIAAIVYLAAFGSGSGSPNVPATPSAWLVAHQGVITALNHDVIAIGADSPATGPDPAAWPHNSRGEADLAAFHRDVATAAALPTPAGSAAAPWRQLLHDYAAGSSALLEAMHTANTRLASEGWSDMRAGTEAANRWGAAMGVAGGSASS
jgi:hypothetical protein